MLVPRETPLSLIHLENMLRVTRAGAMVLPAMPGWYHRPRRLDDLIDFIVGADLRPAWHRQFHDHALGRRTVRGGGTRGPARRTPGDLSP